ncbi:MAG: hypothetical protein HY696_03690 [Deltaproteobacteria bacterium]|nr:hypothetical protein [Deltaproteobacteria bacterium]
MRLRPYIAVLALSLLALACGGKDYTPIYFPTGAEGEGTAAPAIATPDSTDTTAKSCSTQFTTTLCVTIIGEQLSVGGAGEDPLCAANIPPIPLEISAGTVRMRGDLFPDIIVEGHGLPVPITINGRGSTDGRTNIGEGAVGADGNLSIEGFAFYVTALEQVGQIPDLNLTTGETPAFPKVEALHGQPATADGSLTLVGATRLGSLFPSADAYLKGATLTATFSGKLDPPLSACGTAPSRPIHLEITKLIVGPEGDEAAIPIPDGNRLEISAGTFIPTDVRQVGPRFEAAAKFRLVNLSDTPLAIKIPPRIGPFFLSSASPLNRTLPVKGTMTLTVIFRPDPKKEPGLQTETVQIGGDPFTLTATALATAGRVGISIVNSDGQLERERVDQVVVGELAVPASPERAYFACQTVLCGGIPLPTQCQACTSDPQQCQLLTIGERGEALTEVDAACQPVHPHAHERLSVDFSGTQAETTPAIRILTLRNDGPNPLTIRSLRLREVGGSASSRQFLFRAETLYVSDDFNKIRNLVTATAGSAPSTTAVTKFPLTLPPYDPPLLHTQAYFVIAYHPNDLAGSDGRVAGVGAAVTDRAVLELEAEDGTITTLQLSGLTTIKDVPPLQVYFATGNGLKERSDGSTFAFQGITRATTDLAVPVLIRVGESAPRPVRVTGVRVTGADAAHFEWLDSTTTIAAKPAGARCTLPLFGPDGGIIGINADPRPVSLAPSGYDLTPGATPLETMPLFGCLNFHVELNSTTTPQRQFRGALTIQAEALGPDRKPLRNPDGSIKQSTFTIPLLAVIEPRQGPAVLRITQTMSTLLNPQFPTVAAAIPMNELQARIAEGEASQEDQFLILGAFLLDPFDQQDLKSEEGAIVSTPGDGVTAVFRRIDTHPTSDTYDDPALRDYTAFAHDGTRPAGSRGVFWDYPNVPPDFRANSLKIFTETLSNPGPLAPEEKKPHQPSRCESVDPCSPEGQRKYGTGPTEPGKKGVCAFFNITAGTYQSPAFHTADEMPGGTYQDLCATKGQKQALLDIPGSYTLDGQFDFTLGLRFWGPNYFHNPAGPLGPKPPLDQIFHLTFTTRPLLPPTETPGLNVIPDPRVNAAKQEHKINLTDPNLETPAICARNTNNDSIQGERYSTWRYIAPLLSKDPEGLIPAGCPETGNTFTGGSAYLHGRPLDHETGIFTVVGVSKFGTSEDLTFAFKDVVIFIVLNGWLCDPAGSPDQLEGEHCFDLQLNERDAASQISIVTGAPHG